MIPYTNGPCESNANLDIFPNHENGSVALLQSALIEAAHEGQLFEGLTNCSKILESDPEQLIVCVLPEKDDANENYSLRIQTILMESICLEYGIPVVRVESKEMQLLQSHFLEQQFKDWRSEESSPILEWDCFIIKKNVEAANYEKKIKSLLHIVEDDSYTEFPK